MRGYLKLSCVNLSYYDQMSILLERLYTTGGDAEKYELEIKKLTISVLIELKRESIDSSKVSLL